MRSMASALPGTSQAKEWAMLEELSRRLGPQRKLREPEMELLRLILADHRS
jgi:hypothetical protein